MYITKLYHFILIVALNHVINTDIRQYYYSLHVPEKTVVSINYLILYIILYAWWKILFENKNVFPVFMKYSQNYHVLNNLVNIYPVYSILNSLRNQQLWRNTLRLRDHKLILFQLQLCDSILATLLWYFSSRLYKRISISDSLTTCGLVSV